MLLESQFPYSHPLKSAERRRRRRIRGRKRFMNGRCGSDLAPGTGEGTLMVEEGGRGGVQKDGECRGGGEDGGMDGGGRKPPTPPPAWFEVLSLSYIICLSKM